MLLILLSGGEKIVYVEDFAAGRTRGTRMLSFPLRNTGLQRSSCDPELFKCQRPAHFVRLE